MKHLSLLLIGVLILFVALVVTVSAFMTEDSPPQGVIVVPVDPTITRMEEELQAQEATYQARLSELEQSLQQRQREIDSQVESLNNKISAAQEQFAELKSREETLTGELQQLEIKRTKQLAIYRLNLQQSRDEHLARQTQLQRQLEAAQAELDQVETELRR
jgi:peptidoglycan hydrolase CwlO-like protein